MFTLHFVPPAQLHHFVEAGIVPFLIVQTSQGCIHVPFTAKVNCATLDPMSESQNLSVNSLAFCFRMVKVDDSVSNSDSVLKVRYDVETPWLRHLDSVGSFMVAVATMETYDFVCLVVAKLNVTIVAFRTAN
jgi:hypothetical protein